MAVSIDIHNKNAVDYALKCRVVDKPSCSLTCVYDHCLSLTCEPRRSQDEVSLIFDTTCHHFFDAISSKKTNPAKMFQSLRDPH